MTSRAASITNISNILIAIICYVYSEPELGTTIRIYRPRFDAKDVEAASRAPLKTI